MNAGRTRDVVGPRRPRAPPIRQPRRLTAPTPRVKVRSEHSPIMAPPNRSSFARTIGARPLAARRAPLGLLLAALALPLPAAAQAPGRAADDVLRQDPEPVELAPPASPATAEAQRLLHAGRFAEAAAIYESAAAASGDLPLTYHAGVEVGPAFGAARLARIAATGEDPVAVCRPPPVAHRVEPDPARRDFHGGRWPLYRRLYQDLRPHFAALAG